MDKQENNNAVNNMTVLSKNAFTEATIKLHSAEDAVCYLRNDLITRNVRSNLEKLAAGREITVIQKMLVDGLMENHPDMKRDSVERRVRGWLDPKSTHSLKREDAIEIAFILRSSFEDADEFIALVSEEKLHWRSPEEIVCIYGLIQGMTYRECMGILQLPEIQEVLKQVSMCETAAANSDNIYTEFIRHDVEQIRSQEELIRYLQTNHEKLGHYHNTAYEMFMEMLGKLESPTEQEEELNLFKEDYTSYTIRDILNEYLYQHVVLSAKQRAVKAKKEAKKHMLSEDRQYTLDLVQKAIADSWPDEVSISKMKNRKMDITRKCLILLFLATNGDYEDDYDDYEHDEDLTENAVFEDTYDRLNAMLLFSGFSGLDPRNPFDWLIIYCIYVPDIFDVDPRLRGLLEELFRKEESS